MVRMPAASSAVWVAWPTPQMMRTGRGLSFGIARLQPHLVVDTLELDELRAALAAVAGSTRRSDPVVALLHAQLAEAELDAGFAAQARATASRGVDVAREALPPRNIGLANPLFALARADLALGRAGEAEPLHRHLDPPVRESGGDERHDDRQHPDDDERHRQAVQVLLCDAGRADRAGDTATEHVGHTAASTLMKQDQEG